MAASVFKEPEGFAARIKIENTTPGYSPAVRGCIDRRRGHLLLLPSIDTKLTKPVAASAVRRDSDFTRPGCAFIVWTMTPQGETLHDSINGVEKGNGGKDAMVNYKVLLAERRLAEFSKIEMVNPLLAKVGYSWQRVPNRLGRQFDASGELVKGFSNIRLADTTMAWLLWRTSDEGRHCCDADLSNMQPGSSTCSLCPVLRGTSVPPSFPRLA